MREIHSQVEDRVYHRKSERTGDVDEEQEDFNLRELFWTGNFGVPGIVARCLLGVLFS